MERRARPHAHGARALVCGRSLCCGEIFHEGLGFDKVTVQFPGALFLSAGGYHHHYGTNIWAAGSPVASDDGARLLEWNIHLPLARDVAEVARSLEAGGINALVENGSVLATDPWGTNVRNSAHPSA